MKNARMERLESSAERVARILAADLDVNVVISDRAMFDGKTRTLHIFNYENMIEDPDLANVWRGILDHECGHAVYTDFDAVYRMIDKLGIETWKRMGKIWNAFEDIMMEKDWLKEYPGSQLHFDARDEWAMRVYGGSEITNPEYRNPRTGEKIGVLGALIQALCRTGSGLIKLDEVHADTRKLIDLCWDEANAGWNATDTQGCLDAAEALWKKLNEPPPPPPPPEPEEEPEEEESEPEEEPEETPETLPGESEPGEPGQTPVHSHGEPEEREEALPGTGGTPEHDEELKAEAIRGDFADLQDWIMDVISSKFAKVNKVRYTTHPYALTQDEWRRYPSGDYVEPGKVLRETSQRYARRLTTQLSSAVLASRRSLVIGGMDDGEDLDDDALPGIALQIQDSGLYTTTVQRVTKSSFIGMIVDCSGSMMTNTMEPECPNQVKIFDTLRPSQKHLIDASGNCVLCGDEGIVVLRVKSQHAAVTAMSLHRACQECRIPHGVIGYNTFTNNSWHDNSELPNGRLQWSRLHAGIRMHEFVSPPGVYDQGYGLSNISGSGANADAESVLKGANYFAEHAGDCDRLILMVIADGLPNGIDDDHVGGAALTQAVERIAQAGIEVYGIGIGIHEEDVFRTYYPTVPQSGRRAATGAVLLDKADGLTDTVLRSIAELVSEGYGFSRGAS